MIDTIALETKYCQLGQFNTLMDNIVDNGLDGIVKLMTGFVTNY